MAYVMHIGFDNDKRFERRVYYFKYKDVHFKLIQNNPRKWQDVLLTVLDDSNDKSRENHVFGRAAEYISALSWENNARSTVSYIGGHGAARRITLRKARCSNFTLPRITFGGLVRGCDLARIPYIENENQRKALALLREARSTNSIYLSFLFFWQILEIPNRNAIGWVNHVYRRRDSIGLYINRDDLNRISLGTTQKLGNYLYDDCRNAIAHITRHAGSRHLKIDDLEENVRLIVSTRIVEELAKFYIAKELGLNKHLYLLRKRYGDTFPSYMTEEESRRVACRRAYPGPNLNIHQRRRSRGI